MEPLKQVILKLRLEVILHLEKLGESPPREGT